MAEGTEGHHLTSTPLLSLFLDSVRGSVTVRHPDLAMSYDSWKTHDRKKDEEAEPVGRTSGVPDSTGQMGAYIRSTEHQTKDRHVA